MSVDKKNIYNDIEMPQTAGQNNEYHRSFVPYDASTKLHPQNRISRYAVRTPRWGGSDKVVGFFSTGDYISTSSHCKNAGPEALVFIGSTTPTVYPCVTNTTTNEYYWFLLFHDSITGRIKGGIAGQISPDSSSRLQQEISVGAVAAGGVYAGNIYISKVKLTEADLSQIINNKSTICPQF